MLHKGMMASMLALTMAGTAFAQDVQDEESVEDIIVVSAMRVSAGGAQDINHFRSIALEENEMPRPESLTVEGLLGQHDLNLPLARECRQLLCLATESMAQSLPTRPHDRLFVGLGFTSNVEAATWQREPLNLVAVVDKSGSMSGEPLTLVKQALTQIANQMTDKDRMSIILYGDRSHVWLNPTAMKGNRADILAAIAGIESSGSTNMEEGLEVGFKTAHADAPGFRGTTRVMLFTDEQPNVGATDASSFMGMAKAGADAGIGMTTIGVGVQYDGTLARQIGSVSGGNLFFVEDEERVAKLFGEELDTMVSAIAHDIHITMTPVKGYAISGVFGVPDALMEQGRDGAVSITVPTAFFSNQAGGIFVALGKESGRDNLPAMSLSPSEPLMTVALDYRAAHNGKRAKDELTVAPPAAGTPSAPLAKAHVLVDQYLTMRDASLAYHRDGKVKEAHRLLSGLKARLAPFTEEEMEQEHQLVAAMLDKAALMSGYEGEVSAELRKGLLDGEWVVRNVEGVSDISRGDRLQFDSEDEEMVTLRDRPRRGLEQEDIEAFAFDPDALRLTLPDSNMVLKVKSMGDRLRLRRSDVDGNVQIDLVRVNGS